MNIVKRSAAFDVDAGREVVEADYRSHRLWQTKYMRGPTDPAAALALRSREEFWRRQMGLSVPGTGS
jgi:hypothetical protein